MSNDTALNTLCLAFRWDVKVSIINKYSCQNLMLIIYIYTVFIFFFQQDNLMYTDTFNDGDAMV